MLDKFEEAMREENEETRERIRVAKTKFHEEAVRMPNSYDATTRKWRRSDNNEGSGKKKKGSVKVSVKRMILKKSPKKKQIKLGLNNEGRGAASGRRRF